MKKEVVKSIPEPEVISSKEASALKYYGVLVNNLNRGVISASQYSYREGIGPFFVRAASGFTNCNFFDGYKGETLSDCINCALNKGSKVFQFDTPKELFSWLVEDDSR